MQFQSLTFKKKVKFDNRKIKVCLWNTDAPGGNKVKKAIFSFKVKVKVKRSLTLVSFERVSLVEYACQIWSLYLLRLKVIAKVKVDNRQTDKQTDRQTDRTKTICPGSFDPGHKNNQIDGKDKIIWSGGFKTFLLVAYRLNIKCWLHTNYW